MQDVKITFVRGPLSGAEFGFELGTVMVGRQPGHGGLELKSAESSVSRRHAELRDVDGAVELHNLSPNGTQVNGKVVHESIRLEPGVEIAVGNQHAFRVNWATPVDDSRRTEGASEKSSTAAPGPLASPVVRAVIGLYLLAMVALAVWLAGSGKEAGIAADDWPALRDAYESYQSGAGDSGAGGDQLAAAEMLVRKVRALKTQQRWGEVARVCRQLMDLDRDIDSPLFRYGVECLALAKSQWYE